MTPDVVVLVAASRSDHPHHRTAYGWLQDAVAACAEGAGMRLVPMVVASFLRLTTHSRIFVRPTPIAEAMAFVDALLAVPGVDMPVLGSEWPVLRRLSLDKKLTANDIPDAWLAAAVIHLGEHLVTFDVDFRRLLGPSQVTLLVAD